MKHAAVSARCASDQPKAAAHDHGGSPNSSLYIPSGSGQAAEELAMRYGRVIAQDASPAQLAAAGSLSRRDGWSPANACFVHRLLQ